MEKSSGFVVYRLKDKKPLFLLLKYSTKNNEEGHWGFPKGHLEKEEDLLETAKRELFEETGIKEEEIKVQSGFKEWNKYFFKKDEKTVFKIVFYFLAETKKKRVKLSSEHTDFKWLNYEEAMKQLTFSDTKKVLKKAKKAI